MCAMKNCIDRWIEILYRPSLWSVEHVVNERGRPQTWPAVDVRMKTLFATTMLQRLDLFQQKYCDIQSFHCPASSKTANWRLPCETTRTGPRTHLPKQHCLHSFWWLRWGSFFLKVILLGQGDCIVAPPSKSLCVRTKARVELATISLKTTSPCVKLGLGRAVQGDRLAGMTVD